MPNAILGGIVRIRVSFHDWAAIDDDGGALVDPASVTGSIKDSDLVTLSSFTPIRESLGVFYYDWTPNALGDFYVEFLGVYEDDSEDVIRDLFTVTTTSTSEGGQSEQSLGDNQYLNWMTELSPAYIDPDEVLAVYPDAYPLEALEFIGMFSNEVKDLLGLQDDEDPPFIALEYIRAATLCSLSRLYDVSSGDGDLLTLGDLTIQQGRSSGRIANTANAKTWCELAYALRNQLYRAASLTGIKAIEKGIAFPNPIPIRALRSLDQ